MGPFGGISKLVETASEAGSSKDKDGAVTFKIYYKSLDRYSISFLLPNHWLITFTFYPKYEAKKAAKKIPQVGGLAKSQPQNAPEQKTSHYGGRTKQADLLVSNETGRLKRSAETCLDFEDENTVIGGYWLPNGVFVRRVEIKQPDTGALPPAYAEGEVRVVGCPLDEEGLALARFVVVEKPWEGWARALVRKVMRRKPLMKYDIWSSCPPEEPEDMEKKC